MALGWGEEEEVSWGEHQRWVRRTFSSSPSQSLLPSPPGLLSVPSQPPPFFYLAPIPPLFFTLFIFPILPTSETSIPPSHKGFGGRRAEAGSDERTSLPLSLPPYLCLTVSGKEMHMTYNVSSSRVHQFHYSDFFASLSPLLSVFSFTHTHTRQVAPHLTSFRLSCSLSHTYCTNRARLLPLLPLPSPLPFACQSAAASWLCVSVSGRRRRMNTPMKEKGGRRGLVRRGTHRVFLTYEKDGV